MLFRSSPNTCTVSMGNGSMTHVLGEGQVKLELSSGNFLILDKVYHISDIRKNLISTSLLVQQGYKVVFESNRIVITSHCVFIGKCYICESLFQLSLTSLLLIKYLAFLLLLQMLNVLICGMLGLDM